MQGKFQKLVHCEVYIPVTFSRLKQTTMYALNHMIVAELRKCSKGDDKHLKQEELVKQGIIH